MCKKLFLGICLVLFSITPLTAQDIPVTTVYQITWNPIQDQLAFTDYSNIVQVWNPTARLHLASLSGKSGENFGFLRWSADGTRLAANTYIGRTIDIWNTDEDILLASIDEPTGSLGLDWTPDGNSVLTSTNGIDDPAELRQWDVETNTLEQRSSDGGASGIWRSPDEQLLATTTVGPIVIRDALTLEVVRELSYASDFDHQAEGYAPVAGGYFATTATWSEDGSMLAGGYLNGIIRIWETDSFTLIREFKANNQVYDDAVSSPAINGIRLSMVREVVFSLDNQSLWAVSFDGTLRQWELQTENLLFNLQLGTPIFAAAWSPYRVRLAVGTTPGDQLPTIVSPSSIDSSQEDASLQILIPIFSVEQLNTLLDTCISSQQREELGIGTLTLSDIPKLLTDLQSLPESLAFTGCFADILSLAERLVEFEG